MPNTRQSASFKVSCQVALTVELITVHCAPKLPPTRAKRRYPPSRQQHVCRTQAQHPAFAEILFNRLLRSPRDDCVRVMSEVPWKWHTHAGTKRDDVPCRVWGAVFCLTSPSFRARCVCVSHLNFLHLFNVVSAVGARKKTLGHSRIFHNI